ncbi:MAG: hypothetical protein EA402_10850 [Planctomycetota bacterium]|nr:MAG: hypothetical protein EA402_10850 [Planctomycetota bacterium]
MPHLDATPDLILPILARSLGMELVQLEQRLDEDLEQLGLDSHGLMRCTLEVEAALGVDELSLADEALETPRSLVQGYREALARRS